MNSPFPSIITQFNYYKTIGENAMDQVSDEQLFWQYNAESNSIATIVKHLSGNMLSRWTDFLTTDGEKEWRNRETEFENDITSREALNERWLKGWKCLFHALDELTDEDLDTEILIRNRSQSVLDAIHRQLAHYPYHIGQIIYIAKMVNDSSWKSLSIPRGKSDEFNTEKFNQPTTKENFIAKK